MSYNISHVPNGKTGFSTRVRLQDSVIPRRQVAFSLAIVLTFCITTPAAGQKPETITREGAWSMPAYGEPADAECGSQQG